MTPPIGNEKVRRLGGACFTACHGEKVNVGKHRSLWRGTEQLQRITHHGLIRGWWWEVTGLEVPLRYIDFYLNSVQLLTLRGVNLRPVHGASITDVEIVLVCITPESDQIKI